MILEEREKAPKPITVVSDGDEPESLTVTNSNKKDESLEIGTEDSPVVVPAEPAAEAKPEQSDEQPMPPPEVPPESAPGAIFHPPEKTDEPGSPLAEPTSEETKPEMPEGHSADPEAPAAAMGAAVVAEGVQEQASEETPKDSNAGKEPAQPVPAEPPAGQELHIPAGTGHAQVRHKPRIWVWIAIGIIVLIWIYAAVDALTNTKLPLEFFENSNQTAQPVTNAPVQPTPPAQTMPPPAASAFVLPSGWTWYENKGLGFKFAYPEKWGSLTVDKQSSAINTKSTYLKFSKNDDYYIRINDKEIKDLGSDDGRNGIQQLKLNSSGKLQLVSDGKVAEDTIDKIEVSNETCGYIIVDESIFNDDPENPGNIEQYVVCSLANSSGVFILSHMGAPKDKETAVKTEITSVSKSFQSI
jgi:hypothetical protein